MKAIAQAVEEYLAMRRSLGFKLRAANGLRDFAAHMRERGAAHVTIQLALDWARKRPDVQPVTLANRLSLVRQFARYLSPFDPHTQIPPPGLLRRRSLDDGRISTRTQRSERSWRPRGDSLRTQGCVARRTPHSSVSSP